MKFTVPALVKTVVHRTRNDAVNVVRAYMEKISTLFVAENSVPIGNACTIFRNYAENGAVPNDVVLGMCTFLLLHSGWSEVDVPTLAGMMPFMYAASSADVAGPVGQVTTRFAQTMNEHKWYAYRAEFERVHEAFKKWHGALGADAEEEQNAHDAFMSTKRLRGEEEEEDPTPLSTYKGKRRCGLRVLGRGVRYVCSRFHIFTHTHARMSLSPFFPRGRFHAHSYLVEYVTNYDRIIDALVDYADELDEDEYTDMVKACLEFDEYLPHNAPLSCRFIEKVRDLHLDWPNLDVLEATSPYPETLVRYLVAVGAVNPFDVENGNFAISDGVDRADVVARMYTAMSMNLPPQTDSAMFKANYAKIRTEYLRHAREPHMSTTYDVDEDGEPNESTLHQTLPLKRNRVDSGEDFHDPIETAFVDGLFTKGNADAVVFHCVHTDPPRCARRLHLQILQKMNRSLLWIPPDHPMHIPYLVALIAMSYAHEDGPHAWADMHPNTMDLVFEDIPDPGDRAVLQRWFNDHT